MKQKEFSVIGLGLMSGTSLDGLDMALVKLFYQRGKPPHRFDFLACKTIEYPESVRESLSSVFEMDNHKIEILDQSLGELMCEMVNGFLQGLPNIEIDFIASHGHTVFHQPDQGYTLQIGDVKALASALSCPLVYDFRTQDVVLGGQGAPLVPIGDQLLFGEYDYCLNLGGFANVSFGLNGNRVAKDICPVNTVLNTLSEKLGKPYDDKGEIAANGFVLPELLEKLNTRSFYEQKGPKSLGVEFVKKEIEPLIFGLESNIPDIMRTYVEHVAIQIAAICKGEGKNILVTGGGAKNDFLLERIRVVSSLNCIKPSDQLVDFKEALIFALLGFLKLNDMPNCLSTVTGAKKDHSSGRVYIP